MAATNYVTIWCDGTRADGSECVEFIETGCTRTPAARQRAKVEGWRHTRDGADFCPACRKALVGRRIETRKSVATGRRS